MKNKLFFSILFVFIGVANCLAQVPDSIANVPQPPVSRPDTLPIDTLVNAGLLDTVPTVVAVDTSKTDSLTPKKRGFLYRTFKADYPNPNKALYLSLVFPAGGQLYNKRWWKAPIIWGGYVALIYSARYNTKWYKEFQKAYIAELNDQPHRFEGQGYNAGDLKRQRDAFDKNKQLSYIGMFGLHIIQAAEAFVDCHLKTFDVSDDLSLRIKPSMQSSPALQYPALGVGVAFCFGK